MADIKDDFILGNPWDDAVEKLKTAGLNDYIRTHEEVAKDLIQVMVNDEEKGNECKEVFCAIGHFLRSCIFLNREVPVIPTDSFWRGE